MYNEFGFFFAASWTHNFIILLTLSIGKRLPLKSMTLAIIRPWHPLLAYGCNTCKVATSLILVGRVHLSIEIVSKFMILCNYYAAKNSKFIACSLIFWMHSLCLVKKCLFFTKCVHINSQLPMYKQMHQFTKNVMYIFFQVNWTCWHETSTSSLVIFSLCATITSSLCYIL